MKTLSTLLFLITTAYSSSIWSGNWVSNGVQPGSCLPGTQITLTQSGSTVSGSWTWSNSQSCQNAGIAGQTFSSALGVPSDNTITLSTQVGGLDIEASLIYNGTDITLKCGDGDSVFFAKDGSQSDVDISDDSDNWAGVWTQSGWQSGSCVPANPITMTPSVSTVEIGWTWANSPQCENFGLAGQPFVNTLSIPSGNSLSLDFQIGGQLVQGTLSINGNDAVFQCADQDILLFTRSSAAISSTSDDFGGSVENSSSSADSSNASESTAADSSTSNQDRSSEVGKFASLLSISSIVSALVFLA